MMEGSAYHPAGSDHSGAPWNRPDIEPKPCGQCNGAGFIWSKEDWNDPSCDFEKEKCEYCKGTGEK